MTDIIAGFFAPLLIYGLILALHLGLPAFKVKGYVRDKKSGELLRYRLNGPLVLACLFLIWGLAGSLDLMPWDWLYSHRWSGLAGSCAIGLLFSIAIVSNSPSGGKAFLTELYLGRIDNPQFFKSRLDAKMFLYLVGAAMLGLNLLSFLAHHILLFRPEPSPGLVLYCILFLWFVIDYLVFERVHLYTYDIFAERVGFKLGWGCLTFYPYFYAIGLWSSANLPDPGTPSWLLLLFALIFFSGWILSRGANMQKYFFKTQPERGFLGYHPATLSDGRNALLCGGFWGLSRHVNYLGEILMALGLTLALGRPGLWAAWLYPLYYVLLLLPRERADERRCAAKYGRLWKEYARRVPKRIIPGIY
jgi:protein-S-isoprenylcysteine O-methyltransferase Ste14